MFKSLLDSLLETYTWMVGGLSAGDIYILIISIQKVSQVEGGYEKFHVIPTIIMTLHYSVVSSWLCCVSGVLNDVSRPAYGAAVLPRCCMSPHCRQGSPSAWSLGQTVCHVTAACIHWKCKSEVFRCVLPSAPLPDIPVWARSPGAHGGGLEV